MTKRGRLMIRWTTALLGILCISATASAQDFRAAAAYYETGPASAPPRLFAARRNAADRPLLDSLPTIASVTFNIAELVFNSPVFGWTTAFVPQILRSIRVVRRGPPPGVVTCGDTLVWIASPLLSRAQTNQRQYGRLIWPPLRERPLVQRFVLRREGGCR